MDAKLEIEMLQTNNAYAVQVNREAAAKAIKAMRERLDELEQQLAQDFVLSASVSAPNLATDAAKLASAVQVLHWMIEDKE